MNRNKNGRAERRNHTLMDMMHSVRPSAPTGEERGEERERMVADVPTSPPLSPWTTFIGEVERVVFILFHW
jgi:hypothetical protein